jgi:hypothetical protein
MPARYTPGMDKPTPRIAFPLALAAAVLLLAACGNNGPLTLVSEAPPVAPMAADATVPADTLPDTTPPEQPPATDVAVPPSSDTSEEIPPPPETGDDGG